MSAKENARESKSERKRRNRDGTRTGGLTLMARQKGERRVKERSGDRRGNCARGEVAEGSGTGVSDEGAAFELRGRP